MRRAAVALLLLGVTACSSEPELRTLSGKTFGTFYEIKWFGERTVDEVRPEVEAVFKKWNGLFSTYHEDSEISRFNRRASVMPFYVSDEFRRGVEGGVELARKTGGAFDPTVGPLLRLYGMGPVAGSSDRPPTLEQIAEVMAFMGHDKVILGVGAITKKDGRVELDLNAIAKGAGVDRVCGALQGLGIASFMVNIGGEVACRGRKPGSQPWTLGIENPKGGGFVEAVPLRDEAMATSGSYRQFKAYKDGKRTHHIVDPRTGKNADNGVTSVSVVAKTCELADGLATALMVVGPEGAEAILDRYPNQGLRALFLLRGKDGELVRKGIRW